MGEVSTARSALEARPEWSALLARVQVSASRLGAPGFSLGVAHDDQLSTFNGGFLQETNELFASVPVTAELPGPAAYRTGEAVLLVDRRDARARFPQTAGIDAGHAYQAVACLPLTDRERMPFGYLCLHFAEAREFGELERRELQRAAHGTATELFGLLRAAGVVPAPHPVGGSPAQLREEVLGLRAAMASRAVIEQAKGILMGRYGLTEDRAWAILVRRSSEQERKVRELAEELVESVLPPRAEGPARPRERTGGDRAT